MAQCKECNAPIDEARFRSEYCDDACRMRFTRRKEKALKAENVFKTNNSPLISNILEDVNPNKTNNNSPNKPNIKLNTTMANEHETTSEFLLKGRILELQAMNAELKSQFQKEVSEYKSERKELEKEVKNITRLHNDLVVNFNSLESKHEQELNGLEQGKKSFGRELVDLIKDKDVMGNVLDAVAMFRNGDGKDQGAISGTDSEELQGMAAMYNSMGDEHQKMAINCLYIYSKRPDLLERQVAELEGIVNGAGK